MIEAFFILVMAGMIIFIAVMVVRSARNSGVSSAGSSDVCLPDTSMDEGIHHHQHDCDHYHHHDTGCHHDHGGFDAGHHDCGGFHDSSSHH